MGEVKTYIDETHVDPKALAKRVNRIANDLIAEDKQNARGSNVVTYVIESGTEIILSVQSIGGKVTR